MSSGPAFILSLFSFMMIVSLQSWKENASFIPLSRKEVFGYRSTGLSWAAQMAVAVFNNTALSLLVFKMNFC